MNSPTTRQHLEGEPIMARPALAHPRPPAPAGNVGGPGWDLAVPVRDPATVLFQSRDAREFDRSVRGRRLDDRQYEEALLHAVGLRQWFDDGDE
jgi:hypothetical protein